MAELLESTQPDDNGLPLVLKELNPRQREFAKNLAIYGNPLKSARIAGFSVDGAGSNQPYILAADVRILAAMEYWKELFSAHSHTTPEKILANLSLMANIDVTSFFNNDWSIKAPNELDEHQKQALTGVEIVEKASGRTIKFKTSKLEANKELANIHRMYDDDKSKANGMSLTIQLGQQVVVNAPGSTGNTNKDNDLTIELSQ